MSTVCRACSISKQVLCQGLRFSSACVRKSSSGVIHVHPRVQDAIQSGAPVVAFESTIITHGMPYPHNLEAAKAVEDIAEDNGVVPATIGILAGKVHVGLTNDQLEELATSESAFKVSRRDLAWAVSQSVVGGTTVSATTFAAWKANIPIFVTGGIGGVHRGAEISFDVSCDLSELGRTPVCVVSAGIKSILDIPKTLEYLESEGVTVATFGDSLDFPAFYSPKSGVRVTMNLPTARDAAKLIRTNHALDLQSGMLVAVPIPEEDAGDGDLIERSIQQAVIEAEEQQIQGKGVTPFILQRVNELTSGKTLRANIALIKNNAKVGSEIAKEFVNLRSNTDRPLAKLDSIPKNFLQSERISMNKRDYSIFCMNKKISNKVSKWHNSVKRNNQPATMSACGFHGNRGKTSSPVVIGASIIDFVAKACQAEVMRFMPFLFDSVVHGFYPVRLRMIRMMNGATNTGSLRICYGGVARNLADCLTRLGGRPLFVSAIGNDPQATGLLDYNPEMRRDGFVQIEGYPTAAYCATLNGDGELILGVSDMDIADQLKPHHILQFEDHISSAPLVILDANSSTETINCICELGTKHSVPVWFEPTCMFKGRKPFMSDAWRSLTYASPNLNELRNMYAALEGDETISTDWDMSLTDKLREVVQLSRRLLTDIYCLVVTLGEDGVVILRNDEPEESFPVGKVTDKEDWGMISAVYYPPFIEPGSSEVVSVSGAGDCFASGMITGMLDKKNPDLCLKMGLYAAQMSLRSIHAIPEFLQGEDFSDERILATVNSEPSRLL